MNSTCASCSTLPVKILRFIPSAALIALLAGCGASEDLSPPAAASDTAATAPMVVAELFLAKASYDDTRFEHFKFAGGTLYMECGALTGGRTVVEESRSAALEGDAARALAEAAIGVDKAAARATKAPPGDFKGLLDPGVVEVSLRTPATTPSGRTSFTTGLNDVVNGGSALERSTLKLARTMRGAATEPPCGQQLFFGIPRG